MLNIFRNFSIKRKLISIILLTSGIVLLVSALTFVVSEALSFRRSAMDNLSILAGVVGKNVTAALTFNDEKSATDTLSGLSSNPHIISSYVIANDNRIFAFYCADGKSRALAKFGCGGIGEAKKISPEQLENLVEESRAFWEWDLDLDMVREIILDKQKIGLIIVQADVKELLSRLCWLAVIFAGVCLAAFLIAYLLSNRLQKLISGPIMRLTETMNAVSKEQDYSHRALKESNDEIGVLIDGFNTMLEQIHLRDEQLRRSGEELKDMNEEVKNFAYIVSHDLRAPLVSIKGFTSELEYTLKDIDAVLEKCMSHLDEAEQQRVTGAYRKDVAEAVNFIGSSVNRMDGLINSVLNLSRVGRRELKPEPVDLNAVTDTVLTSLAHQLDQKKVKVTKGALPEIIVDRISIEQIMGNLIDNALKYLEPGRDGEIAIIADQKDGKTTFHVSDNGRGIAGDDIHKVFDLFRRVGKQDVKGEGMGLTYVKTLVRRHGGRIWCESEPGKGTRFSFYLA